MKDNTKEEMAGQPFYVGENVIAVDALTGACIKNGLIYQIYSCELRINPANGLGPFWYVGVEGNGYKSHDSIRPSIFAPIQRIKNMSFEKMTESCPIHIS